jgi:hypothetical protein
VERRLQGNRGAIDLDNQVKLAAARFLIEQTQLHGNVLPRVILVTGFAHEKTRIP